MTAGAHMTGRRVLVTGGLAAARAFAAVGAQVLTTARTLPPDAEPGSCVVADLGTAAGAPGGR